MTETQTPAGWYYMQGDPPNTQRWWDGLQWTGEAQAQQPVAAVVEPQAMAAPVAGFEPAAAEQPTVEIGSQLSADLASYWDSMEEKVDPAAQFADESAWDQEPSEPSGDTSHLTAATTSIEGGESSGASPLKWMFLPFKNYANFKGRSCRAEFFWFTVMYTIISWCLLGGGVFFGLMAADAQDQALASGLPVETAGTMPSLIGTVFFGGMIILALVSMIPSWAVSVRRLHDTGRSGWAMLLSAIPFIGSIWLLIIFLTPSNSGWNKYGDGPIQPV